MNQFDSSQPKGNATGFIAVRVSTAGGAIPLEGAAVSIRGEDAENSGAIRSVTTNSDGLTDKIELPTPQKALSTSPNSPSRPYSVYNIDVFKEGYIPLYFTNVPVFPGVISIQPAVMVPARNAENQLLFPNSFGFYSETDDIDM